MKKQLKSDEGKIGYVLAWALGVPLPLLAIWYFLAN
jgi:hypothetical protein